MEERKTVDEIIKETEKKDEWIMEIIEKKIKEDNLMAYSLNYDWWQDGPCKSCGIKGYGLSMGGPAICPACDCGRKGVQLEGDRLERHKERLWKLHLDNLKRDIINIVKKALEVSLLR